MLFRCSNGVKIKYWKDDSGPTYHRKLKSVHSKDKYARIDDISRNANRDVQLLAEVYSIKKWPRWAPFGHGLGICYIVLTLQPKH